MGYGNPDLCLRGPFLGPQRQTLPLGCAHAILEVVVMWTEVAVPGCPRLGRGLGPPIWPGRCDPGRKPRDQALAAKARSYWREAGSGASCVLALSLLASGPESAALLACTTGLLQYGLSYRAGGPLADRTGGKHRTQAEATVTWGLGPGSSPFLTWGSRIVPSEERGVCVEGRGFACLLHVRHWPVQRVRSNSRRLSLGREGSSSRPQRQGAGV